MARISGINIPNDKKLIIALTYIFGIGPTTAAKIIKQSQVDGDKRVKELTEDEIEKVRRVIGASYKVEGDLRLVVSQNIKRLKDINSYRGVRHTKGLPLRGQKTKNNSRTKRGKKVTMGSGKKVSAQKT